MKERYVIQMQINGECQDWGRTNDPGQVHLMWQTATCYGTCRIVDRECEKK